MDKNYISDKGKIIDIGKVISKVFTFDLIVNVTKSYKNIDEQQLFENCNVNIHHRNLHQIGIPQFKKQGQSAPAIKLGDKYILIANGKTKKISSNAGKNKTIVEFKNLICTKSELHHYLITLENNGYDKGIELSRYSEGNVEQNITFISDKLPKSKVKGQIFYTYKGSNSALPLKSSLVLKVCYVAEINGEKVVMNQFNANNKNTGTGSDGNNLLKAFNLKYPDNEKSLGYTISNSSGEFEFNVDNIEDYSETTTKLDLTLGSGEFKGVLKGNVYRCLRVVVNNGYYTSPDVDIFINPLENKNVGKLTANVRAMKVKVICQTVKNDNQAVVSGSGVPGLDVSIKRKGPMPEYFPPNEGNVYKSNNTPDAYKKSICYGTSDENGTIIFDDVVISNGQDFEKLFISAKSPDLKGDFNYTSFGEISLNLIPEDLTNKYKNYTFKYNAIYNSDYEIPTLEVKIDLLPLKPKIKGRVLSIAKSSNGLSFTKILLNTEGEVEKTIKKEGDLTNFYQDEYYIENTKFNTQKMTFTDKDGYFEFENIDKPNLNGNVKNYSYSIEASKYGYYYEIINGEQKGYKTNLGQLKLGEQRILPEIYLKPSSTLSGQITDENGNAVACYVAALGADLKESDMSLDNNLKSTSKYSILLAPGNNVKIVVWPKDLKYFIDTISIPIIKLGNNTLDIKLSKRLHRMMFYITKTINSKSQTLANASVEVEGHKAISNASGVVLLEFENASTFNFTANISGPKGESYISQSIKITNYESKKVGSINFVNLEKGQGISGVISMNGKPYEGAMVIINKGSGVSPLQTRSNKEGKYELEGIETDKDGNILIKVIADDEKTTIVGIEEKINIKTKGKVHNFE